VRASHPISLIETMRVVSDMASKAIERAQDELAKAQAAVTQAQDNIIALVTEKQRIEERGDLTTIVECWRITPQEVNT